MLGFLEKDSAWRLGIITFLIAAVSQAQSNVSYYNIENISGKPKKIFTRLQPSETGIHFQNTLTQTKQENIFVYKGFYKGGGVAIGDINNDGLQDIYFTGNQVPDKLYLNKGNLLFEDITDKAGILQEGGWSTHVTMVDVNNDGFKDIYVCKSLYDDKVHLRENELYINNGNTTFTESAELYGLNDNHRTTQANFFDFDRDGDLDVFIINQPKNSSILAPKRNEKTINPYNNYRLLENKNGRFVQSSDNGNLSNSGYGLSSVIADFNNDGWQDIYVANDYKGPDFFYVNNKDGTFSNRIYKNIKHTSYFSMGSDIGDINNDGWLDFVVLDMVAEDNFKLKSNMSAMNPKEFWTNVSQGGHYQYMFNTLQLNNGVDAQGNMLFSEIGQMAGVQSTDWSWSPLLADFDNDGLLDLFVTNGIRHEIGNTDALKTLDHYIGEVVKKYDYDIKHDQSFDIWNHLDLDKILSLFPSDRIKNYMYKNATGLKFKNVTDYWGLDEKRFSTGAAYGDLDNDGDLDLVVNNIDDEVDIYKNHTINLNSNNYLRIGFLPNKNLKNFIGTRVTLFHNNGSQTSQLTNARGINSSSEEMLHFGLKNIKYVDSLRVDWNTGKSSMIKGVKVNQTLQLKANDLEIIPQEEQFKYFEDITDESGVRYVHKENVFDDYGREVLLPHRMSTLGSGVAVTDTNSDGLEDFYIGGSRNNSGKLLVQQSNGRFIEKQVTYFDNLDKEDMGSLFFDADNDGDQDLYVVTGGNESENGSKDYQDRLYINLGDGTYSLSTNVLPAITASGGRVKSADYDNDGDLDLFIGGRQVPGRYPEPAQSYILKNLLAETGSLKFLNTNKGLLNKLGMVTDAVWTDFDGDQDLDILVTGMWMPITVLENKNGVFYNSTKKFGLEQTTGWWFSISKGDLDHDGDDDYVLGNLGLNYKYKTTEKEPFSVHYGDFDNNGKNDIVLSYYNYGEQYPLRGRSCSSQQIPNIKNKFKTYNDFAGSSLIDVYGSTTLNNSLLHYEAKTFQSITIENSGQGQSKIRLLPDLVQVSNINSSIIYDVDKDGINDLIIAGNLFGSEIETPRNDASLGLFLKGRGNFQFDPVPMGRSGLNLAYDVKEIKLINYQDGKAIVAAVNNGKLRLIKLNEFQD